MLKNLVLTILFAIVFTGCAEINNALKQLNEGINGLSEKGDNKKIENDVLMIVLDASKGMDKKDRSGERKIEAAQEAIIDVASQLDSDKTTLGLVAFNGNCQGAKLYAQPNNIDFSSVIQITKQIEANGNAPLARAINGTGGILQHAQKKARIILISTGKESCQGDPKAEAQKLYKYFGSRLEFYVIGYDVNSSTKKQLQGIANSSHGQYYDVKDKNSLIKSINKITDKVYVKDTKWDGDIFNFQISFDSGSSVLNVQYDDQVKILANYLKQTGYRAELQGHTDSLGGTGANQALSQRRAQAVVERLKVYGVEAKKVYAKGYGEARPKYSNKTQEGRVKNRRVEAHIIKKPIVLKQKTKQVVKKSKAVVEIETKQSEPEEIKKDIKETESLFGTENKKEKKEAAEALF